MCTYNQNGQKICWNECPACKYPSETIDHKHNEDGSIILTPKEGEDAGWIVI